MTPPRTWHLFQPPHCPACGKLLDYATETETYNPGPPRPGDASVCLSCGALLRWDQAWPGAPLTLRPPTMAEEIVMRAKPLVRRCLEIRAEVMAEAKPRARGKGTKP